jgi:hypothetical protein
VDAHDTRRAPAPPPATSRSVQAGAGAGPPDDALAVQLTTMPRALPGPSVV